MLIGSALKLDPEVPSPAQFDHVITVVQEGPHANNEQIWLDATPEVAPYRMLVQPLRDKQALLIPGNAPAVLARTPSDPPFASYFNFTAHGTLDGDGTMKGHIEATTRGDAEVSFRMGLHQTGRPQWSDLFQNVSYAQGFAGTVSNADATLPEKTGEPFHYSYDYERKEFSDWANRRISALLPPVDLTVPGDDKPDDPIELGAPGKENYISTIKLPDGYTAQLPAAVTLTESFADYSSTYSAKDGEITVERKLTIKASKVPLADWEAYKNFQKKVMDDYGVVIQLYSGDQKDAAQEAGNPEAQRLVQQAFQQIREHQFSQAAETLEAAEHLNPEQLGLWAGHGYLEQQQGNADAAFAAYRKEIKLHPRNKGAWDALIWTESHLDHKDMVTPTLQEMTVAFPDDGEIEGRLGNSLMFAGEYTKAIPILTKATKDAPANKELSIRLGIAQMKSGMKTEGDATIKAVLSGSDDPLLLNNGAYELADAGLDLPLAEADCRQSLELQDKKSQLMNLEEITSKDFSMVELLSSTWDTMGWILFREGKLELAEAYLKPGWLLKQSNTLGNHLGQIYEAQGKLQEARMVYEQALRSQAPGNSESDGKQIKERALKLARGKPLEHVSKETEELLKLRTIELPEFVQGYHTADFNLVWSGGSLQDAAFVKGDESLRPALAMLKKANPAMVMPPDSKAKVVRRGVMACSENVKACQLVLMYPMDAEAAAKTH